VFLATHAKQRTKISGAHAEQAKVHPQANLMTASPAAGQSATNRSSDMRGRCGCEYFRDARNGYCEAFLFFFFSLCDRALSTVESAALCAALAKSFRTRERCPALAPDATAFDPKPLVTAPAAALPKSAPRKRGSGISLPPRWSKITLMHKFEILKAHKRDTEHFQCYCEQRQLTCCSQSLAISRIDVWMFRLTAEIGDAWCRRRTTRVRSQAG
jgi:hypothetical protein